MVKNVIPDFSKDAMILAKAAVIVPFLKGFL